MITIQDIGTMLDMLEANYGTRFLEGVDKKNVVMTWAAQFRDDDPAAVMAGVQNCINTMSFRPTIADIRKRMAGNAMQGQMTTVEAFNEVEIAVRNSYDRESAAKAYNDLPRILRKLVGTPSKLISWHNVSDESFQTVIMSAIRESYRELAQREADYHALPEHLKKAEGWRVDDPGTAALPEPEKSISEVVEEANARAAEHGMIMTDEMREKHSSRIDGFLAPMTKDEKKLVEKREEKKAERWVK